MEFAKLAEQQVYQRVQEITGRFRRGEMPEPTLIEVLQRHGVDVGRSWLACLGEVDTHLYSGTVVNQHRRVIEFVIDTTDPDGSSFDDVTEQLGPKDPRHPRADMKDVITMSLVCYDGTRP